MAQVVEAMLDASNGDVEGALQVPPPAFTHSCTRTWPRSNTGSNICLPTLCRCCSGRDALRVCCLLCCFVENVHLFQCVRLVPPSSETLRCAGSLQCLCSGSGCRGRPSAREHGCIVRRAISGPCTSRGAGMSRRGGCCGSGRRRPTLIPDHQIRREVTASLCV